jgi:hypothetical protein
MLYKVKAKIDKLKMKAFYDVLTDGTIADQEPDGAEIVNAMQKAVMTGNDTLEWYETCHCATPLKHERETVYDIYLHDIETTLVEERKDDLKGNSFWVCLEDRHFHLDADLSEFE